MPDGTVIVFGPVTKFASMIAARSVHLPEGVLEQTPVDGSESGSSSVLFTTYVLAASAGLASTTKMSPTASAAALGECSSSRPRLIRFAVDSPLHDNPARNEVGDQSV